MKPYKSIFKESDLDVIKFNTVDEFVNHVNKLRLKNKGKWVVFNCELNDTRFELKFYNTWVQIFRKVGGRNMPSEMEMNPTYFKNWLKEHMEYLLTHNTAKSKCPSGWRLPTIQELYTAYVQKVEGFKSDLYWSSSTYAQNTDDAWVVDFDYRNVYFDNGGVFDLDKTSYYYVRCVRDI